MAKHWQTWRLRHWSARFLTRYQRWWLRQMRKHLQAKTPGQDTAVNRSSHCCRTGENTVVDTLIEVKAKAVISTSPHVEPKIVTDTLTRY